VCGGVVVVWWEREGVRNLTYNCSAATLKPGGLLCYRGVALLRLTVLVVVLAILVIAVLVIVLAILVIACRFK
jgi:hypothetical protein